MTAWDAWKERNAWWWDWLTAPLLLLALLVLTAYRGYLWMCSAFCWKPWRLP